MWNSHLSCFSSLNIAKHLTFPIYIPFIQSRSRLNSSETMFNTLNRNNFLKSWILEIFIKGTCLLPGCRMLCSLVEGRSYRPALCHHSDPKGSLIPRQRWRQSRTLGWNEWLHNVLCKRFLRKQISLPDLIFLQFVFLVKEENSKVISSTWSSGCRFIPTSLEWALAFSDTEKVKG